MIKKEYSIKDDEETSVVFETKRQKDILSILDEMLEIEKLFPNSNIFEDDFFYIEYTDGTNFVKSEFIEDGIYRKKGIQKIVYTNSADTWAYGQYQVNEYGIVS